MKHGKRLVALFMSLSLIANHTSTVIALGDEYKKLFIEQSLNAPNITWDTKNEVIVGTAFDSMKGVKAIDDKGNDIIDKVKVTGSVDTSKEGEYALTYSIADSEEEPITRVVRVIPNPEFNVSGADYVRTYKGEEFDYKQGLTVTDSKGNDITSSVTCEGNVDVNKLGSYNLKYYVPDKKEPILERTVDVIEKNVFNVYLNNEKLQKSLENYNNWLKDPNKDPNKPVSIEKDLAFSIYLDNKTSKFALENQSSEKLDVSIGDEVFANIKVFDKDNNEKLSIELLGSDTGNSEKLDKLKELTYEYGDYISIVTRDSKNCLDITGTLTGDIDNTKEDCKEYYSDGVDNLDYIKNVRFNIVKEGIKTVYNNAPVITGLTEMEKLLTTRDEQLKGISITDDKDTYIPLDEVVITEEKDGNNIIGLRYTVCDDWGREASGVRYLKNPQTNNDGRVQIEQAIQPLNEDRLSLLTAEEPKTKLSRTDIEIHGIEYKEDNSSNSGGDTLRFKIGFDQDKMQMIIKDQDSRIFDNKSDKEYFRLELYTAGGTLKKTLILNGNERPDSDKVKEFYGTKFEYGDQIKLYHKYSDKKLKIVGQDVQTASGMTTKFSAGIPSDELKVSRFEIKETGLKQLVNKPPVITWDNTTELTIQRGNKVDLLADITVKDDIDGEISRSRVEVSPLDTTILGSHTITYTVKDSWGAVSTTTRIVNVVSTEELSKTNIDIYDSTNTHRMFTISFDDFEKKMHILNTTSTKFNESSPYEPALNIKVISKNGVTKKDLELYGKDSTADLELNELDGYKYVNGDYLEIRTTTSKAIRINGKVTTQGSISDTDFSNGLDTEDLMDNTRFQLNVGQMAVVYNEAPKIEFKQDVNFERTDIFNPAIFVNKITDDHDNKENGEGKLKPENVRAEYNQEEIYNLGSHSVKFILADTWGREYTTTTTIQTVARNELEKVNIELMKVEESTKSTIATLYFDDVKNRIIPVLNTSATINGESGQNAFIIYIYGSNNQKKGEVIIDVNSEINKASFDKLKYIEFQDGDYIHIQAYSPDAVRINGNVISPMGVNFTDYSHGFKDFDKMKNTMFEIQEDGLTALYNEAPHITFPDVRIFQGDDFNVLSDIIIKDDRDKNLTTSCVTVEGDTTGGTTTLDTTQVGNKKITYEITDSWGRTALIERTIFVRPHLEKAQISIKNKAGQTAIVLNPDSLNRRLNVEFKDSNLPLDAGDTTTEVSLALYNEKNEHVGTLDILGDDTKEKIQGKLQRLINVTIVRGSKIHIDAQNTAQVSITGIVSATGGNITTGTVDYATGGYDKKYLENTVFKLIDDGIEVVYNEAPNMRFNITGSTTTPLTIYKGDDYRKLLLDLVEVTDELEPKFASKNDVEIRVFTRTTTSNTTTATSMPTTTPISISTSSSVPIKINTTGSYIAYYVVKDSWGKESKILKKDFNVVTSIGRNIINLGGYNNNLNGDKNIRSIISIGFNPKTMHMDITTNSTNPGNQINNYVGTVTNYYTITVYSSSGTSKGSITMGAEYDYKRDPRRLFSQLENIQLQYGDYIKIYAAQSSRISIDGPVRTPLQNNYANGVNSGDIFISTVFDITEDGIDDRYIETIDITTGQTLATFDSGANGYALKFKIDSSTGKIIIPDNLVYNAAFDYINDSNHKNDPAFKIKFTKVGTIDNTTEFTFTRNGKGPDDSGFRRFVDSDQNKFKSGDYIEFWFRNDSIPNRFNLKYNMKNLDKEDYSDGIQNAEYVRNVRFYFRDVGTTSAHLEAVYNEAPRFEGVDEVNFQMGDNTTSFSATSGVVVVDDHDTNSSINFSVSKAIGPDDRQYNTIPNNAVRTYKYIYNTTDSWGRSATTTRYVYVRPNVYKNKIMLYPKTTSATTLTSNNASGTTTGVVITSDSTAAFGIVGRNRLGEDTSYKYRVVDRKDVPINPELGDNPAFKITIHPGGVVNNPKVEITLNGNDTGMSPKLDKLETVAFEKDDHIRVWAADSRYLRVAELTSPETTNNASQPPNKESYDDGIQDPDNMNNVAFILNNSIEQSAVGMKIAYNAPANITTTRGTLKYKEQIPNDLRDLVRITDDRSNASQMTVTYEGKIDTNKVGKYPVTYTVVDSWGREVKQTIDFKVVPYYNSNEIKVYSNDGTHMFDIGFNTDTNKLSVNQITTNKTTNTSSGNYLKIVTRDQNAEIIDYTEIKESEFTSQASINKIKAMRYANRGFISIESASPSSIRITGNVTCTTAGSRFDDGFDSLEQMKNSRFMLDPACLKLITYEEPVITFKDTSGKTVTSTSITRGDDSNLYNSIDLGFKQPENYLGIKYSNEGLDKYKFGKQDVTFMVNDSWDTTTVSTTAVVDVKARNYLEGRIIQIKDGTTAKKNLATLRFDTINKKIITNKLSTSYNGDEDLLLTFKLYDKYGITKKVKRITKYNITSSETLEKLFEDVYFEDGDRISLESYDDENGIAIYGGVIGDVTSSQEDYSNGVQNSDYIDNVRFEINKSDKPEDEGTIREYKALKSIYNHAPEISFTDEITAYKGIEPDFFYAVNITDSDIHDKDITIEDNVQIDTDYDPNEIGIQLAQYTVSDTWGRETITERSIDVRSGLLSNRIEYYTSGSTEKSLFYIYLDNKNHELKVGSDYKDKILQTNNITIEPFELTLYTSEAKIKANLKLDSGDGLDKVREKLTTFSGVKFEYGDYLGVYAKNHKDGIKILGRVDVPISLGEDYSQGITTPDHMNNVKFEITEEELKAVYNEAPTMDIPTDSTLEYYKGDPIMPGEGLSVKDDLDLDLNSDNVYVTTEEQAKFNVVGTTEVSIRVTDKWGRTTEGKRKLVVKNSLSRNVIHFNGFDGHQDGNYKNDTENDNRKDIIKISFDTTNNTIQVENNLDNRLIHDKANSGTFYKLYISRDGTTIDTTINLETRFNNSSSSDSAYKTIIDANNRALESLQGFQFEENGYIKIYANQTQRVSLDGTIRDAREDFSDGVNQGDDFLNTKFYFTESGLKAVFENPISLTTNDTLIEFNTGGNVPFRLKVDHNTGIVEKKTHSGEYNWTNVEAEKTKIAFKFNWYDSDDRTMRSIEYKRNDKTTMKNIDVLINDNGGFKTGDYITFETPDTPLNNMIRLIGNVIKETTQDTLLARDDFSDGIDFEETMLRTRFYYNKDNTSMFTAVKMLPALIKGADDIWVLQGSTFDFTSGVTAIDQNSQEDITSKMTIKVNGVTRVRNGRSVEDTNTIDTSIIGPQEVEYTVTNESGITSSVFRTINVYSTALLTEKKSGGKYVIEQGQYASNYEGLEKYLLSLVQATDTKEDGDGQETIDITSKVTVKHDIDIEQPGIYNATYSVTNSFGKTATLSINVEVARTISVGVPVKVPFQIVTNLINKDDDPFVAGTLNLKNYNTSDVKVSLDGFTQKVNSGSLQIVSPGTVTNWDNLTTEETMSKMALGIYNKAGFKESSYSEKANPLWLHTGMTTGTTIGTLERAPSLTSPSTAKIGFTSKHGKKFIGGTSRGKFELRFRFE